MSYSTRLYAKEYAGGDRTFEISYTGAETRTPFIVYTNAYHGYFSGFEGVYTKSRTSTLAWLSNFAGNYSKTYEGYINYESVDTETYSKVYAGLVDYAGTIGYRKEYGSATNQPDSVWAAANILANYTGAYSTDLYYSRTTTFAGVGPYDGASYTSTYVGSRNFTPTYSGFIGFSGYTKTYVGTVSYDKNYSKLYAGDTVYQAEWQRAYTKSYTGTAVYTKTYTKVYSGLVDYNATPYVGENSYIAWSKNYGGAITYVNAAGAGFTGFINYTKIYQAARYWTAEVLYSADYNKNYVGAAVYTKDYTGRASYLGTENFTKT